MLEQNATSMSCNDTRQQDDLRLIALLFKENENLGFRHETLRLRAVLHHQIMPAGRRRLEAKLTSGQPVIGPQPHVKGWQDGMVAVLLIAAVLGLAYVSRLGDDASSGLSGPLALVPAPQVSAGDSRAVEQIQHPTLGETLVVAYNSGGYDRTAQSVRAVFQNEALTKIWVETRPGDRLVILGPPIKSGATTAWPIRLVSGETLALYNAELAERNQRPVPSIEGWVMDQLILTSLQAQKVSAYSEGLYR